MRLNSIITASVLLLGTTFASLSSHAEDLQDIYQAAVENDPIMRAARAELRAGQENKKIARAALLPQLRFNASISKNDSESETQTDDPVSSALATSSVDSTSESLGLTLSQQIFNLNSWYSFKSGSLSSRQAELEFINNQQELMRRTASAYFEVLRANNNLASSLAEEKAMKQQLDQMQQRFDVGLVAITDVHEARAAYDLARVNRISQEGNLKIAYEALTVLTGSSHSQLATLSDNFPISEPEPAGVDEWVNTAQANNVELKSARSSVEIAEYRAKASQANHYPVLALTGNYNESTSDGDRSTYTVSGGTIDNVTRTFEADADSKSIALTLSVPLYSGGGVGAQRRQAWARYESARENMIGTQRSITQQTRSQYIAVLTQIQKVAAHQQAIVSAQSALDAIQAGYNVGTRNIVDVLNAQRNLFAAQRDYGNSRYDYILTMLDLKYVAGTLTPDDLEALNNWVVAESSTKALDEETSL